MRHRCNHHAGEHLHGGNVSAIKGVRCRREDFEHTERPSEMAQRSREDGTYSEPAATREIDTRVSISVVAKHNFQRTPRSGAVRPVRARQTISFPFRKAIAAPVAPVRACARSAIMLIAGSRSISAGWISELGPQAGAPGSARDVPLARM